MIIPHGKLNVSFHEIMASPFFFEGNIKSSTPKKIAIIVSSKAGKRGFKIKERLIHENAARIKTKLTHCSSYEIGPNSVLKRLISFSPPGNSVCLNLNAWRVK